MTIYTLSTRFARFENGEYVEYPIGTPVDLSLEEVGIFIPGVATLSSQSSQQIVEDDSKLVFRTTLAQPKKKGDDKKGEEVSDVSGSKYCEGEPGTIK